MNHLIFNFNRGRLFRYCDVNFSLIPRAKLLFTRKLSPCSKSTAAGHSRFHFKLLWLWTVHQPSSSSSSSSPYECCALDKLNSKGFQIFLDAREWETQGFLLHGSLDWDGRFVRELLLLWVYSEDWWGIWKSRIAPDSEGIPKAV